MSHWQGSKGLQPGPTERSCGAVCVQSFPGCTVPQGHLSLAVLLGLGDCRGLPATARIRIGWAVTDRRRNRHWMQACFIELENNT